jgi:hypothetical protein
MIMTAYETQRVTITSGVAGAAGTGTLIAYGELVKIEVNNGASVTNSWVLTVYQGTAGGNDDDKLFYNDAVSNATTAAQVFYPQYACAKAADGTASTLTESYPVAFGLVTVSGASMGNSKSAVVALTFKVA